FGQQHFRENVPSQSDDLFAIIYTSGTTGLSKGVMLSHNNLLVALCSVYYETEEPPGSRIIFYLPLTHICGILIEGFAIGTNFIPWANQIFRVLDYETLVKNDVVVNELLQRLNIYGKNNGLKGFEQVKAVHLDNIAFSVENGLLTNLLNF
ncbi:15024_t:CDS:2, partial [Cetraspora pellucida]